MTARSRRTQSILDRIDHPVIDADGHTLEYLPAVREHLRDVGGPSLVAGFEKIVTAGALTQHLSLDERRAGGMFRMTWWGFPARNSVDRATAMLPKLQYERLDELGIDYAVLYPTYGLSALGIADSELRQGMIRAFNNHFWESFRPYADRISHVSMIPMHTPDEAIAELDYVVNELGAKTVLMAGFVYRPLAGENLPPGARWVDTFGLESPYDYDPLWARCVELGVSPTFHSSAMGWDRSGSQTNYMYNHLGNFAAAGETTCRSLFMDGVPRRFPQLRFAFLEGGAGWGVNLYCDLLSHFEKRNRDSIRDYDPANLDRLLIRELFARYASEKWARDAAGVDESLDLLCDPGGNPAGLDEFARSGVRSAEDIRDVFTGQFYFGCEADDPLNATAFDRRLNPFGVEQRAIFGSDIGHWDVPDTREVLGEAWELVEKGLLTGENFRAFVFDNPVRLLAGTNPRFFAGTVLESKVGAAA